jgi:hypothetical protein
MARPTAVSSGKSEPKRPDPMRSEWRVLSARVRLPHMLDSPQIDRGYLKGVGCISPLFVDCGTTYMRVSQYISLS